jgi:hypothetical protein
MKTITNAILKQIVLLFTLSACFFGSQAEGVDTIPGPSPTGYIPEVRAYQMTLVKSRRDLIGYDKLYFKIQTGPQVNDPGFQNGISRFIYVQFDLRIRLIGTDGNGDPTSFVWHKKLQARVKCVEGRRSYDVVYFGLPVSITSRMQDPQWMFEVINVALLRGNGGYRLERPSFTELTQENTDINSVIVEEGNPNFIQDRFGIDGIATPQPIMATPVPEIDRWNPGG